MLLCAHKASVSFSDTSSLINDINSQLNVQDPPCAHLSLNRSVYTQPLVTKPSSGRVMWRCLHGPNAS